MTENADGEARYAVYIVIIEDTNEADMALAESVESLDRVAEGLTYQHAEDCVFDLRYEGQSR